MNRYVKIVNLFALILISVFGSYSATFPNNGERAIQSGAAVEETDVRTLSVMERRNYIALVCDAVCTNAPYLCKVAFCSVILNRCNDESFPNTPAEVVYLDQIFANVYDDWCETPSEAALMAYDDALNGFSPCPDALYYSTTDTSDLTLKTRQTLFQIGKYIFS